MESTDTINVENTIVESKDSAEVEYDPRDFGWEQGDVANKYEYKGRDEEKVSLLEGRAPPFKYLKVNGSESNSSPLDDLDPEAIGTMVVGFCCCLCILGVLVTGVVLTILGLTEDYSDMARAGFIILGLSFALGCACCCACCVGCASEGPPPIGESKGGSKNEFSKHENSAVPKRPRWVFKRRNDRHTKEKSLLKKVYSATGPKIPKAVEKLLSEREKEVVKRQVAERKKEEAALLDWVKNELKNNKTVTATQVRKQMRPTVFAISFDGDTQASQVTQLRDQVTLILQVAGPRDEVVVLLTTGGGAVASYGLAAAQLIRLRNAGIRLTVCIDTVAASGGYMIAVCANKILASPFAYVGSIGVVTYIPNVHRALENKDVDVVLATAGKYKRTVDVVGEVTEEGKQKLQEELEDIHHAFKEHVRMFRPQLNMDSVATGEAWLAVQAKSKGLIDDIMTSDDYLLDRAKVCDVLEFAKYKQKENIMDFLSSSSGGDEARLSLFSRSTSMLFNAFSGIIKNILTRRSSLQIPRVESRFVAADSSPFEMMALQQV